MGPGDSHAGITVPEGNPGQLHELAQTYQGLAGAMQRSGQVFGALPGDLSSWQGPASVSFASAAFQSRFAADQAAQGFAAQARAARDFADDLQDAQRDAKDAIADAREAEQRIRRAKELIADAKQRREDAQAKAATAKLEIAAASATGDIPMAAYAAEAEAGRETEAAEADQQRGQRLLEDARDDLDRAKQRGRQAEQRASDAATRAQGLFVSTAPVPALMPLGSPALGIGGEPANPLGATPALVPLNRLSSPGARPTTLRRLQDLESQPTGPSRSGFDPLFGQDPLTALGWGITGGTGGYVNRAQGARKARRGANERLTRASDPSRKLTESGYRQGLRGAERGASEGAGVARSAAKGLKWAKPLGPVADVGTGVYDGASGQKGWARSAMETTGSILGGVGGGLGAGALGIESGPGAFVTGAAGATAGSAGGKSLAGEIADALGIH